MGKLNKKKNMPTWVGTAIVCAILAVVVLFSIFCVLSERGVFLRMRKVAESEHYTITVPMMSYLLGSQYEQAISNYNEQLEVYKQYGLTAENMPFSGDKTGDNLNTSGSVFDLRNQIYKRISDANGNEIGVETWYDYFASATATRAEQILTMCEQAFASGMTLTEDELAVIDSRIALLETYAQLYGYGDVNGFLGASYGTGVTVKDVRAMEEMSDLASKYAAMLLEQYENGVGDDRIDQHYADNKSTYDIYMDFIGYSFDAIFNPSTSKDETTAATENAAAKEKYEQEAAKFAERVKEFESLTTVEEFTAKLRQYLYEDAFALEKEKAKADLAEGEELSDTQISDCSKRAEKTATEAMLAATVENYKKDGGSLSSEVEDWLFETKTEGEGDNKVTTDLRQVGDVKVVCPESATEIKTEGTDAYKKTTTSYSVYIVSATKHRSTGMSVAHILFKTETYKDLTDTSKLSGVTKVLADEVLARDGKVTAEGMAKRLIEVLNEEGHIVKKVDEDNHEWFWIKASVFEEFGEYYTEDSSVSYDDVVKGQMVQPFEDWLFDDERELGEMTAEAVKTEYGYHVMYNYGQSWKKQIKDELANGDYTAECERLLDLGLATFNEKQWKHVAKY